MFPEEDMYRGILGRVIETSLEREAESTGGIVKRC